MHMLKAMMIVLSLSTGTSSLMAQKLFETQETLTGSIVWSPQVYQPTAMTEATKRYGKVTRSSKGLTWRDGHKWIYGTTFLGHELRTNRDLEVPLVVVEQLLVFSGLDREVKELCGSYNLRNVRGKPDVLSTHAYGLSLDLNCGSFGFPNYTRGWSCQFIRIWEDAGFAWGYYFHDPMHFSWLKPDYYQRATSAVGPCIWLTNKRGSHD